MRQRRSQAPCLPYSLEQFEARELLSGTTDFRSLDGTGNNLGHPEWGSVDVPLERLAAPAYADGVAAMAGYDRLSPRDISNLVATQDVSILNSRELSDFIWMWGQFIDHDIDLTESTLEASPIAVTAGDAYFDPSYSGNKQIDFHRSIYAADTGTQVGNPRQQINEITAYIDGSMVYGSDEVRAAALREFVGGRLKTSAGDLLPFNVDGLPNAGGTQATFFLAGDVRANENIALTAMHTLFVREHNRVAAELQTECPHWSDERLYQEARQRVIGKIQAITYNEFLPALLGDHALNVYTGYNSNVNPGIANEFSTAVFRLGHSLLSPELRRLNSSGVEAAEGHIGLRDAFFNPQEVIDHGIESLLRGAVSQRAQELDPYIVDDVRNFLFGEPGQGGFDLAALNIQRGRDHGLASYNATRVACGLQPVADFTDISSDPKIVAKLAAAYDSVDDIDLWVGALSEDRLPGSSVGELINAIVVDQFERLRDGDRFYYERIFHGAELAEIHGTTLGDIIAWNTGFQDAPVDVFHAPQDRTAADDLLIWDNATGYWYLGTNNSAGFDFHQGPRWSTSVDWTFFTGDVDGDQRTDVIGRTTTGELWVGLGNGTTLETSYWGRLHPSGGWQDVTVGDFDGDGRSDLAARKATGEWWILRSTGTAFQSSYAGKWGNVNWVDVNVGDFNGDGRADIAAREHANGQWWIASGTPAGFQTAYAGRWSTAYDWQDIRIGDFDGDHRDDIIGRNELGDWWRLYQRSGTFRGEHFGRWSNTRTWTGTTAGDFDGDGLSDLIGQDQYGHWWLSRSLGHSSTMMYAGHWDAQVDWQAQRADLNHDGCDDLLGYDQSTETWRWLYWTGITMTTHSANVSTPNRSYWQVGTVN